MAKIIIRKIKIEDFNKIYPLFKQLWPDKNLNKDKLKEVTQRGIKSKNDELFCAELNNEVIGFCAYTIMNSFFQEGYISYAYAMVVDEKHRGQGVGTKLINEVINRSKEQGLKMIELDSGFHREKAHKFYEKLGFKKRAYLFSLLL